MTHQAPATPVKTWRAHVLPAVLSAASPIVMTWPLARDAAHQVLRAPYFWDAYTNAMILGSRADAVSGRAALSLYDNYFFAPLPNSVAFNENLFGLALLFAPLHLASGHPLWAYNVTLMASLALSVFFTYLLVLRLTGSRLAGLISGVAFAFCPYVFFEIGRIQLAATQWIPACFLFLHRALEERRTRDVVGFWACLLLQLGTSLYYAMFLLPLVGLTAGALLWRHRPPRAFLARACILGALAGAVALAMVWPYFAARRGFDLERSLAFAASYDGRLAFFAHVHPTNRTWSSLHHVGELRGAHEEIAFPGLIAAALALGALVVPRRRAWPRVDGRTTIITSLRWTVLIAATASVTCVAHTMLAGLLVFAAGLWHFHRRGVPHPFRGLRGLYLAVGLLALTLFLGIEPFEWRGAPVRGLYYYLHTFVPGFNGIRKVSRQAVMTTFVVCVLAGFGAADVLARLRSRALRAALSLALLIAVAYELRSFPHPVESVWAGDRVPPLLRFVATLPERDLVASVPQNTGRDRFRGDAGMALHNYLALYHRHRFVNGQSSWQPPVTELARRAVERLPDDSARRALASIGTRHLLVFGRELKAGSNLLAELDARPNEYRRVFRDGTDAVYTLLGAGDPELDLLETPPLPAAARVLPPTSLRPDASVRAERAALALDTNEDTFWSSGRVQQTGEWFEVQLLEPRRIAALELTARGRVMDLPASFRVEVARAGEALRAVALRAHVQFHRAQVFTPDTFVERWVFVPPLDGIRLRITLEQPVPGHHFSIGELRVYEAP